MGIMDKVKADAILHDLSNDNMYFVSIHPYCGEYAVEVSERAMCKNHIYISPKIIEVCNKFNVRMSVHRIGAGQEYMRIIIQD